jgi:molecular chaperone GrpE
MNSQPETPGEEISRDQEPHTKNGQASNTITANQVDALIAAYGEEKKRSADYLNKLKYMQADFENYRKRVDRQIEEAKRTSNERLVMDLLEVMDELELAVSNGKACESATITEGVEMTLKKLRKILEAEGVKPIESVGKKFDPDLYSVICTAPREDVEESTVLEELRKGYIMNGKVIRPSMVKISIRNSGSKNNKENGNLKEEKNNE